MPLSKECKMPKIDIDHRAVSRYWGARIVGVDIGSKPEMYRALFIRLTDKALYEYNMARSVVLAQIERKDTSHPLTTFIGGTPLYAVVIANHLETCINATKRAADILTNFINRSPQSPFFINLVHRKNIERRYKNIRPMRNELEHIEKEIRKDQIKEDQPFYLTINEDASEARIGDKKLNLISLVEVISTLHEIALEMASYNAPGAEKWLSSKYILPKNSKKIKD